MKTLVCLALILTITCCKTIEIADFEGDFDISIMSFNLRYDEPEDGDNQWSNRRQACLSMLNEVKPTIFGIQEGLHHQVTFLASNLPAYEYVGVGRDDGYLLGEFSAIFYATAQYELIESGQFWLSETPEIPSLGWDANNIRMVTWAKLNDIDKNRIIYVFNTHFDHKGKTAQQESSELIVQKMQEIAENNAPIFLIGDFNMLIGNSRLEPITKAYFSSQRFADKSDNNKSFNAFGRWILSRNIDFIFYNNVKALAYKTIVKDYGVPFISDHYPIVSQFNF